MNREIRELRNLHIKDFGFWIANCRFAIFRSGLLEKTVAQLLLNETNGIVAIMAASRISASNLNIR
jgi:hypothetical protein